MIASPIFLAERMESSDECYGVIGRALAFATRFELICKALEGLMEMENGSLFQDEHLIENFCGKVDEKSQRKRIDTTMNVFKETTDSVTECPNVTPEHARIQRAVLHGEDASDLMEFFDKWLSEKLEDARNARNEIAHDVTKGMEDCAEHDERRADKIEEVEALVRRIAEADVQVYNFCQLITNEPT
jgi:hypothetical protein